MKLEWWGRWGNCLLYAAVLKWQRGGWICRSRSPVNPMASRWAHLGPAGDFWVLTTFVPLKPKRGLMGLLHKIWFRGEFRRTAFKRVK